MSRGANTKRVSLSVTEQVVTYLEELVTLGYMGATASEVAKYLVQRGIEQAMKDGFLEKPRSAGKPQEA